MLKGAMCESKGSDIMEDQEVRVVGVSELFLELVIDGGRSSLILEGVT